MASKATPEAMMAIRESIAVTLPFASMINDNPRIPTATAFADRLACRSERSELEQTNG
jgi:hypothetical protein